MSGGGAPVARAVPEAAGLKVAIVSSLWHEDVMAGLLAGARRALSESGVTEVTDVRVPGTFELPVVAGELARTHDAVIALGVVIRGGTPHFEYVCQSAALGLTDIAVRTGVPVGFGVLTCDTDEQALDRAGLDGSKEDKGFEAATAALSTAALLRRLRVSS